MRSSSQPLQRRLVLAALFWALGSLPLRGLALTNQGTTFLVGFGEHFVSPPPTLTLIAKGTSGTTGTVEVSGIGSTSFTIPAEGVATVPVPPAAQVVGSDVVGGGILVTTSAPISLYATSQVDESLDGALILPVPALGTDHVVVAYPQEAPFVPSFTPQSQFLVVSGQDGTQVTITPASATAAHPAGSYTVSLQRLQAYQLQSGVPGGDVSGTHITSNAPIAVFAGGNCLRVPPGQGFCSHLVEQMPPTTAWDARYFMVPLATSEQSYRVRIAGSMNNTSLLWDGALGGLALPTTIGANQILEVVLPANQYFGLTAQGGPVLVMEYSQDLDASSVLFPTPFMTLVPGVQRYLAQQTFVTPALPGFQHYVGAALQDDVSLCTLDGSSLAGTAATPVGTSGFVGIQVPVVAGAHTLACPRPIGAIAYGGRADASVPFVSSYGYPTGLFFSSVGAPVASAGADITVLEGTLATLDGSASSSPAGQPLTYAWSQVSPATPKVTLDVSNPARPTFIAPQVAATTTFTFSLVVSSALEGPSAPAFANVIDVDSNIVPPPLGCSSSVLTVADLETEVATIASSTVTISVLEQILSRVDSALNSKNLKVARYGMVLFIGEVVNRSNADFAKAHRLTLDDANALTCGAANVLTKIQP